MSVDFLIVHVSDLHFGSELYPWITKTALSRVPFAGKVYPHDVAACQELENEILGLIRSTKPPRKILLVSGDLTVSGSESQFAMALTFLHQRIATGWKTRSGLGPIFDDVLAIPGNHDQWNASWGRWLVNPAQPKSDLHGTFFVGPAGRDWWHHELTSSGMQLQLMGVDSTSTAAGHVAARGSIDPQSLTDLLAEVQAADGRAPGMPIVRVLTIHHSPEYSRQWSAGAVLHALDSQSLSDLATFSTNAKVHFVLTGHVHRPLIPSPGTTHTYGTELRCGTTLQGAPSGMVHPNGNIFLAHLITHNGQTIDWATRIYQRDALTTFVEAATRRYEVNLP